MTSSVFFRLSGPLQSWAKPAVSGNFVRTQEVPTASALRGLIAAGLGYERDQWPDWISNIDFVVRQDRRPILVDDFHTIDGTEDEYTFRRRLALMQGLRASSAKQIAFKPGVAYTSIVRRTYLADGEFIVQATCEGHTEEIDHALSNPYFVTYLGRKAFSSDFPFYLGVGNSDLLAQIPVVRAAGNSSDSGRRHQHFLGMGDQSQPSEVSVPLVETRAEWFERLSQLSLQRRKTVLK